MKKFALCSAYVLIFLLSCKEEDKPKSSGIILPPVENLFRSYHEADLELNPLNATMAGDNRYNDQLPNNLTQQYKKRALSVYRNFRDSLKLYNEAVLTEEDKMSRAVLLWELDQKISLLKFRTELMPVNQFKSLHLTMGQLGSGSGSQPFQTVKDYQDWLSRMENFTVWCDTALVNMKKGIREGYVLPVELIDKIIPQFDALARLPVEDNLFYTPVKNLPASFSSRDRLHITDDYAKLIRTKLVPRLKALSSFMKTDYLRAGRKSAGIENIPEGKELYDQLIGYYTTTDLTAREIHELGLREVTRLLNEMEAVKKELNYSGDLKSFFNHIRTLKTLMPYNDPEQVIGHFNDIHDRMKPRLHLLFDKTPKTPFEVRRTEAFREASASAEYNQGSIDGSRPGIFYVPIPDVKKYNVYADEDLFLHEAIPGHHYQISLQQENKDLPDFRRSLWYSAYGEGWALYAESLGKELGLYEDPYQYFGMLSAEMHRAIRLVTDTGMHSKLWSRDRAIMYSLEHEAEGEESIIAEIERYMAIPGQALSYKIGQLKIQELRKKAESELGEKFDIKEFHNKVLESGCIPLKLLEQKIDVWIADTKK